MYFFGSFGRVPDRSTPLLIAALGLGPWSDDAGVITGIRGRVVDVDTELDGTIVEYSMKVL
jgi:hypothetical protein